MKSFIKLRIALMLALLVTGMISAWGQAPITVNSDVLRPHGYNSTGADQDPGTEARDSVTVGSTTRYYVVPSALNTSYTGILTGSLTSSFKWTVANKLAGGDTLTSARAINAVGPTYSSFTNYRGVTWGSTGTLDLVVQEITSSGCGGNPTVVPISIVSAPTLTYPAAGGIEDTCFNGTTGNLDIEVTKRFWVSFTSPISGTNKDLQIRANITRAGSGTAVATNLDVTFTQVTATTGYFTIPAATQFDFFDTYTITLASVSDRISRKGAFWNSASGNTTFTYNVFPVPNTGSIYHLPNM